MAKENIKKVIVTEKSESKLKKSVAHAEVPVEMLFKRINYIFILAGIVLIVVGFILMSGGKMPSPEVWDDQLIYNPVKTLVSPIVILTGLVLVLVAIFKK